MEDINKAVKVIDITDPYKNLLVKREYNQILPVEVVNYAGLLFGAMPTTNQIYTPFTRDIDCDLKNRVMTINQKTKIKVDDQYCQVIIQPDFLITKQFCNKMGAATGTFSIGTILKKGIVEDIVYPAIDLNIIKYKCISCQVNFKSQNKNEIIVGYDLCHYHPKINLKKNLNDGNDKTDLRNLLLYENKSKTFVRKFTDCQVNMVVDSNTIDEIGYFNKQRPSINYGDVVFDYKDLEENLVNNDDITLNDIIDNINKKYDLYLDNIVIDLHKGCNIATNQKSECLVAVLQPTKDEIEIEIKINYQIYYLDNNVKTFTLVDNLNKERFIKNEYDDVLLMLYYILKKILIVNIKDLKIMLLTNNFIRTGISKEVMNNFDKLFTENPSLRNLLISLLNNLDN
jgi:hypothetical protein